MKSRQEKTYLRKLLFRFPVSTINRAVVINLYCPYQTKENMNDNDSHVSRLTSDVSRLGPYLLPSALADGRRSKLVLALATLICTKNKYINGAKAHAQLLTKPLAEANGNR